MLENEQAAPRRADRRFITQLPAEVAYWQRDGLITDEQARAVLDRYSRAEAGAAARSRMAAILATLGVVSVGLGVILFLASNWTAIPKEVKLALMVIAVPGAYGAGYWVRYHRRYFRVGTALILLAAILYGASIHLVAQAYHVPVNHPNLVLFWFLGVIPLAFVTRSHSALVLALILLLAAVGFRGQVWLADWDLIPLVGFPLYMLLGLALYSLGTLQRGFEGSRVYAAPFELVGLLVTFAATYLLAFREWWREYNYWGSNGTSATDGVAIEFWVLFGAAAAVSVLSLLAAGFSRYRQGLSWQGMLCEGLMVLALLVGASLVIFVPLKNDIFYPVLFNLLFLIGVVGLLFLGYARGQELLVNLAVLFFSLQVFARYFEFGFDLLDRSMVFVGAGVILLAGGFLMERGRRRVVDRLRSQEAQNEL